MIFFPFIRLKNYLGTYYLTFILKLNVARVESFRMQVELNEIP